MEIALGLLDIARLSVFAVLQVGSSASSLAGRKSRECSSACWRCWGLRTAGTSSYQVRWQRQISPQDSGGEANCLDQPLQLLHADNRASLCALMYAKAYVKHN